MSTIARISLDEFDRIIQSGVFDGPNRRRIELIHGELRSMSPIGPPHEETVDVMSRWSFKNVPEDVRVRVQNSIGLPALDSAPEPDIAWVAERKYSQSRPSAKDVLLVIEVAESSLAYDTGEKADLYAKAKIADYWVVDLINQCVEVFRDPSRGHYRNRQTFEEGNIYPLALPQLAFPLKLLFQWS
jgi:Uma2 family endonuclease